MLGACRETALAVRGPRRDERSLGERGRDRRSAPARPRASHRRAGRRNAAPDRWARKPRSAGAPVRFRERARLRAGSARRCRSRGPAFPPRAARSRIHHRVVRGDRTGAHAILVGESAGQHVARRTGASVRRASNARARHRRRSRAAGAAFRLRSWCPGKTETAIAARVTGRARAAARPRFVERRAHRSASPLTTDVRDSSDRRADPQRAGDVDADGRRDLAQKPAGLAERIAEVAVSAPRSSRPAHAVASNAIRASASSMPPSPIARPSSRTPRSIASRDDAIAARSAS